MIGGRRLAALLLAAYVGLVLWGCLSPFDLGAPTREHVARAEWIPFTYVCPIHGPFCLRDAVRNVALYLPLGLLAAFAWPRAPLRRAVLAAAALSASVELTQLFLPSRRPSTADVLANVAGALLGAAAVRLARRARADRAAPHAASLPPPGAR